jgi:PPOX class probable F420-dependent enzyme
VTAAGEAAAASGMSREEIDAFLAGERTLVLVTLRRDGSPVAHPMWFTRLGDALYVDTRAESLKLRNLARDPRACAVVESGESYFELRGVRVEGRCERVDDPEEIARVHAARAEKDARIGSGLAELPGWFVGNRRERLGRGERVVLRIAMERVFAWDFSKVRAHYARPRA